MFSKEKINTDSTIILTDEELSIVPYLDGNFTFLESEARKHALDIAKTFDAVDGKKRSIGQVLVLNAPKGTEIAEGKIKQDTTPELYIYNFSPSGFAIIGADERSMGHFTSSVAGSIGKESHAGYQLSLASFFGKVNRDRELFTQKKDSILQTETYKLLSVKLQSKRPEPKDENLKVSWLDHLLDIFTPAKAQYGGYGSTQSYVETFLYYEEFSKPRTQLSPTTPKDMVLLHTSFGQSYPYNMKMTQYDKCTGTCLNGRYLTGCVATAYAQVMLYYNTSQAKSSALGACNNGDWDSLYNYYYKYFVDNNDMAINCYEIANHSNRFLEALGGLNYVMWNTWASGGSGIQEWWAADIGRACGNANYTAQPRILDFSRGKWIDPIFRENFGFAPARWISKDHSVVLQSILQKKPVIMIGSRGRNHFLCDWFGWFCADDFATHVWVADGVRVTETTYRYEHSYRYAVYGVGSSYGPYFTKSYKLVSSTPAQEVTEVVLRNEEVHYNWGWAAYSKYTDYTASDWQPKDGFLAPGMDYQYRAEVHSLPFITPLK